MKRRLQQLAWLVGFAGFAVLALTYPLALRTNEDATRWNYAQLHRNASAAAAQVLGVDISTSTWLPKPDFRAPLFLWQQQNTKQPFDRFLTASTMDLVYSNVEGRDITITHGADGRITAVRGSKRKRSRKNDEPGLSLAKREELARQAFQLLAGPDAARFPTQPEIIGESEFRWTAPSASDPRVRWQIAVRTDTSGVREAVVKPVLDDAIRRQYRQALQGMGEPKRIVGGTASFVVFVILAGMLIFSSMRRTLDRRSAVSAALLYAVPSILMLPFLLKGMNGLAAPATFGGTLLYAAMAFLLIGVGQRAARDFEWPQWRAFRLLLQWKWHAKPIGQSITAGLLWSGWMAALPGLVFLSRLFPDMHLDPTTVWNIKYNFNPIGSVISPPLEIVSTATLATLLPLVSQRFPIRAISLLAFLPLAALVLFFGLPIATSPQGAATTALLMSALCLAVYLTSGLLAALFTAKGCTILWLAGSILTHDPANFPKAVFMLAMFAGLWVTGLLIARHGPDLEPVDPIAANFLSHREKLKADFSTAQQAQQRMLPSTSPDIPGFSIAAACQPAREVGGDLYDYFQFPDGRTGFCVADVSGKGMPAALYMTLTKGLIAAASPESSNLPEFISKINRHLHIACKKKMFVTAVVASLDPQTRIIEMVRAGHNPALLFVAATGKARYWKPRGLGLGLTGPLLFDRGIQLDSAQLAPGDTLVLYSDGVTEAMNERLELYGEERFLQAVERHAHGPASFLLGELKKDLAEFTGSEPAHDDVTLLVLQAS